MLKRILLLAAAAALLVTSIAYSAESTLVGGDRPVQTFAPNGSLSQILTVVSTNVDLRDNVMWALHAYSADCNYRLMPSNLTGDAKIPYQAIPITTTGKTIIVRAKNPATPFLNLSGCTNNFLERQ